MDIEALLENISKYIPSWSYFAIEKRDKFWFVSLKIDSRYTKEFSFETCGTDLRHCLNTTQKMLNKWLTADEDIKELREEYEEPTKP